MSKQNNRPLVLGRRCLCKMRVPQKKRVDHLYIIGGSRTGKTSEIYNLVLQEIQAERGVGVIDPHGDLAKDVERAIYHLMPDEEKTERVIILDPTRGSFGFNPLQVPEGEDPYPYVLELISVFKKLWEEAWGARMEDILRNAFLVLAEKNLTLLEIPRLLTDQAFRRNLIEDLKNEQVKEYWLYRFDPLTPKTRAEWIESTLNKVNAFIADPLIKKIVGQRKSTIDFRQIMDNPEGSVLLVRLPKGVLKSNSFLMGALILSKIQEGAMSRVDVPLNRRVPFYLYIDEFQNFGTSSLNFQECLSEAGKYALHLSLAHQNLTQIDGELLDAILGNSSLQLIFRISRKDVEKVGKEIFQVDTEKVKWERIENMEVKSRTYYSPQEEWENKFNSLVTLKPRKAFLNIKGKGTYPVKTITSRFYQVPEEAMGAQAGRIMASYCKSQEQIRKERERLREELEVLTEAPGLSAETVRE